MGAYNNQDAGFAGLDYGQENRIETKRCAETSGMDFGIPAFVNDGEAVDAYPYHNDEVTILWDADFVTSNVITTTINGTVVATTFTTDQATTIALHAADIEAAITGITATVTAVRTIVLFLKGSELLVTSAVTAGSSQAGETITLGTQQTFAGITKYTAKAEITGTEQYALDDAMDVLIEGNIWGTAGATVSANQPVFAITAAGATQGKLTNVSTNNYNMNAFFKSNAVLDGIVLIEVRRMNEDTSV